MNKKLSHTILISFDLLCFWVLWIGFNSIIDVIIEINNQANIIRLSSRSGFYIVGIGPPLMHFLAVVDYFWSDFQKKYSRLVNQCVVIAVLVLLAAGFLGSSWIKTRVEKAGYICCRNASGISALARTLVYAKNMDICEDLVETKQKQK